MLLICCTGARGNDYSLLLLLGPASVQTYSRAAHRGAWFQRTPFRLLTGANAAAVRVLPRLCRTGYFAAISSVAAAV